MHVKDGKNYIFLFYILLSCIYIVGQPTRKSLRNESHLINNLITHGVYFNDQLNYVNKHFRVYILYLQ